LRIYRLRAYKPLKTSWPSSLQSKRTMGTTPATRSPWTLFLMIVSPLTAVFGFAAATLTRLHWGSRSGQAEEEEASDRCVPLPWRCQVDSKNANHKAVNIMTRSTPIRVHAYTQVLLGNLVFGRPFATVSRKKITLASSRTHIHTCRFVRFFCVCFTISLGSFFWATNCARGIALLGGAVVGSFTDGLPVTCHNGDCARKKHRTAYNVSITTIEHENVEVV
jgi:hypothetical protein